ncbi:annexin A2-like [Denticeps clupeoides]|uniref:annexin A2-like n=1 Tax=Denticeps clupeoides TaxID=299321 RepID=UPI0010A55143|nr:annexin A2-like [Denticeps clupeoides]
MQRDLTIRIETVPFGLKEMWWGTLGTIRPFPAFNPEQDAREIFIALDKKDACSLVRILTNRNNAQRQSIAEKFLKFSEKDLSFALKKALSGSLQELMLALMMTPAEFDAHRLRDAMEGLGTDEEALLEVLCTSSPMQLKEITVAYKQKYGRYLENDLISETSKDFSKLVMAILKKEEVDAPGNIDFELIDQDVRALLEAVNCKKTDAAPWIQVLTMRSTDHLNRVFTRLENLKGETMDKIVQNNFSGDMRLGVRILVRSTQNTPLYFAQKLHNSMKKNAVVRGILVSRSEEDLLCVRNEYRKLANTSLYSALQKEYKGELQQALLALCRSEDL